MLVVPLLLVMLALIGPNLIPHLRGDSAARRAATAQIQMLGTALDTFRYDVGRYPTSQEGLESLRRPPSGIARWDGPYIKKGIPRDPWGNSYVYRSPGEREPYELQSYGADGVAGGSGINSDLNIWER